MECTLVGGDKSTHCMPDGEKCNGKKIKEEMGMNGGQEGMV